MKKVCFAASSGGHLTQLLMLKPLMDKYNGFLLTESTSYGIPENVKRVYFLSQVNRKEILLPVKLIGNAFRSLYIFLKEKPDIVITTGVLAVVPMCLLVKIFGKKLVYIESFAKVTSPTLTGKFLYKFADRFYVQWEPLLEFYPKAKCLGKLF